MPSHFYLGVIGMLQVYSNGITVTVPEQGVVFVPFNNVSKDKGCDSNLLAPGTVQINRQGVYDVHVNAAFSAVAAGDYVLQLFVNGVAQPEAQSRVTLAAGGYASASFEDLVTVPRNNTNCCYSSPTLVQVGLRSVDDVTGDVAFANVSQLVTRLC